MKCIAHKDGEVRRVPNLEADLLVGGEHREPIDGTGEWHYVPKSIWKFAGRP